MAKKADGTIRIDVKALTTAYERALKKAGSSAVAFGIIAAEGIKRAAVEIMKLTPEVMDLRNELADMETKTGIAAETLAGLRLAARGSGQEFSDLQSALSQFPKRLADVARGTGEAKVAFDALGISATNSDGSLRSADAVVQDLISAIKRVPDTTTKAALATQAFGEAGGKLLQALGGTELSAYVEFSQRFGTDIGPRAAAAAADWQRASAELSTAMDGIKGTIVDLVAPTETLEELTFALIVGWTAVKETFTQNANVLTMVKNNFMMLHATLKLNFEEAKRLGEANQDLVAAMRLPTTAAKEAGIEFLMLRKRMRETAAATVASDEELIKYGGTLQSVTIDMKGFVAQNDKLADAIKAAFRDGMGEQAAYTAAMNDRIDALRELGEETGKQAEAEMAIQEIERQGVIEINRMKREGWLEQKAMYQAAADFQLEQIDKVREKEKQAAEDKASAQEAQLDATMGLASMLSSVFADSAAQQAKLGEAGKKRAKVQFAASKALSIGVAMMNTAQGVTAALAMYPPNLVLAGIVGAAGAVQVGTIAAQSPSFHIGTRSARAPDERAATVTQNEVVLTPQGAASANAGIPPTSGGMSVIKFGTDYFDAVVRQVENSGGRFSRAVAGRSRIGHRVAR